jgi:hypothetical protein
MKIRATNLLKSRLDLSSQEQLGGPEIEDNEVFRVTIGPNQTITVNDKWYPIANIQGALRAGLIEILEYKKTQDFEIRENASTTTNYSWELPQIEFTPNYPYEELIKYNAIFNSLDTQLKNAVEGYDQFQELLDTPNSYVGEGGKVLAVKDTEDGIEFVNLPEGYDQFQELLDTPNSYVGEGGKVLAVKDTEDGIEFVNVPSAIENHSELNELNWSSSGHTIDANIDFANYGITNVNEVSFNLSPSDKMGEGVLQWNSTDSTLDLGVGGGVVQQIGQELLIKVVNKTGQSIENGAVVRCDGRQGNRPKVVLAQADIEGNCVAEGVATDDIPDNSEGFMTTFGYVRQIKTNYSGNGDWGETWAEGDNLYLSKTVAGQLTNIQPEVPHHSDIIGEVAILGAQGIGSIFIRIKRHQDLEDLADVNGSPLDTSGLILVWDNNNQYWDFTENINDYAKINGGALTGGSIVFADSNGELHQDNANLFWDDINNRLGIGTNDPSYLLDTQGTYVNTYITENSGYGGLFVKSTSPSGGASFNIYNDDDVRAGFFSYGGSEPSSFLGQARADTTALFNFAGAVPSKFLIGTYEANPLMFGTNNALAMTIDADRNVGIGTDSPTNIFHISQSNSGAYTEALIENTAASGAVGFEFKTNTHIWKTGVNVNDDYRVRDETNGDNVFVIEDNAGDNALYIQSGGNVGIGTVPSHPFHVNAGTTNTGIYLESTDSDAVIAFKDNNTSNGSTPPYVGGRGDDLIFGLGADIFQYIDSSSGNVGIGTTTPERQLHLKGSGSTDAQLVFEKEGVNKFALITFGAENKFSIFDDANDNHLMVFDGDNKYVGVGTTNPLAPLHLVAESASGTRELHFIAQTSDAGNDQFGITSGTSANNNFAPTFFGFKESAYNANPNDYIYSMNLRGLIPTSDDVSNNLDFGIMNFETYHIPDGDAGDPNNAASLNKINNRRLFSFRNGSDYVLTLDSDNTFGIGNDGDQGKIITGGFTNQSVSFDMALGMKYDTSLVTGLGFENANASGQVRFMAESNDGAYTALNAPGTSVSGQWLGVNRNEYHFLWTTQRALAIGTIAGGFDTVLGAGDAKAITIDGNTQYVTFEESVGINMTPSSTQQLNIGVKDAITTGVYMQLASTPVADAIFIEDADSNQIYKLDADGNATFRGYLNIDGRFANSTDYIIRAADSTGSYTGSWNMNDGYGNMSISICYDGDGTVIQKDSDSGPAKILLQGHSRDGSISLNVQRAATDGSAVSFDTGLSIDSVSRTIRVGASGDAIGLFDDAGLPIADMSANLYATKLYANDRTFDTTTASARVDFRSDDVVLALTKTASGTTDEVFTVDGTSGRLFTVSDTLTGSIFSVNDISGLPIIEVISDATDTIILGEYGANVGIGEATPASTLDVNGTFQVQNGTSINEISIDGTLADNSDDAVPTEKAVKTYVDTQVGDPTLAYEVVTVTPYTASTNSIILVDDDTVGGDVTINLPDASLYDGKTFVIKKLGTTGKVTIDGNGTQTIDDEEIVDLDYSKEVIKVISDGNNWYII